MQDLRKDGDTSAYGTPSVILNIWFNNRLEKIFMKMQTYYKPSHNFYLNFLKLSLDLSFGLNFDDH